MDVKPTSTTLLSSAKSGNNTYRLSELSLTDLVKLKLTVNLAKSEFCHANLTFLGHVVGQGQVKPVEAKVEAISDFPVPTGKIQLMRFISMAGYYRKFCNNFSVIAEPLTNLLGKRVRYVWTDDWQKSFEKPYLKVLKFS